MLKKNMDFLQASSKHGLSPFGDADGDEVPNILDCKPFDKDRDGLFGRVINVVSGGRLGQSRKEYDSEKAGKVLQRASSGNLEVLRHQNKLLEEKLKAQRLAVEQQQLRNLQGTPQNPTQMLFSNMFGFPTPQPKGVPIGKPGYEVVYSPPLPKGFHWRKIPKKAEKEKRRELQQGPPAGVEHRFMSYPEAQQAQHPLRRIYGYRPEILKVRDPFTGMIFFVVVEPRDARML